MGRKQNLPPGCGLDVKKPILANQYQLDFHAARRLRFCLVCKKVSTTDKDAAGFLVCPHCQKTHQSNLQYPRAYKSLHLRAGRRSGKSLAGAHAVRDELSINGQRWWVCGPTFKMLHDATMPTLLRLIPPEWVLNWNQDNLELELINHSLCQFRSLDDPERGRGQGLHGVWLDEAAFTSERAWNVLSPSLAENAGVVISTTSPGGFDWTYTEFYKRAKIDRRPGYWAAKFKTLDNPLFQQNEVLRREVEEARATMTPELFAAEYEGDDVNFTGAIYGQSIDAAAADDNRIREWIPEWPNIDPSRQVIVGLDSGADHPFGAVLVVVCEQGLVVASEYLERQQAHVTHLSAISLRFGLARFANVRWVANKNEAQLRLEFGLRGVGVMPAENKHQIGIQRVQSWLLSKQMLISKSRCPKTVEQMRAYRWADNTMPDGQKREKEQVFKKEDELPDAVRYVCMGWPELPRTDLITMTPREQARWNALDDQSKLDIERIREYNRRSLDNQTKPGDKDYPHGEFFGHSMGSVESIF